MFLPVVLCGSVRAAAAFSPASLSSLAAWYTAGPTWCFTDAGATTPCGDGDSVYTWLDRSGNANTLTQATSDKRPTLRLVSGKWLVRFDGVDDEMPHSITVGASAPFSGWAAAKCTGGSATYRHLLSAERHIIYARVNGSGVWGAYQGTNIFTADDSSIPSAVVMVSRANNDIDFTVNGSTTNATAGSAYVGGIQLVGGIASAGQLFAGDVTDLGITLAALSTSDRNNLTTYLSSRLPA